MLPFPDLPADPADAPSAPTDPCGGNTKDGPGCSCDPPF